MDLPSRCVDLHSRPRVYELVHGLVLAVGLLSLIHISLNVALHIHPMGKAAAVAYVKKRIAWMEMCIRDSGRTAP